MMSQIPRFLLRELKNINTNAFIWAFPVTVGFTWFIWDALDEEWLVSLKLAPDPEALNKRIESERLARLEALKKPKPTILKGAAVKEAPVGVEEEEPEEGEEVETLVDEKEDLPAAEEEEEAPAEEESEDVPAGEDGDDAAEDEEEDEEEEEEREVVIKPLYDPVKGKKLGMKDVWDNYTIKALNMSEDDDDDDEEEEEEEEEEEDAEEE